MSTSPTATVAHIIANHEIGMTECGVLVDYHDATDATPWGVPGEPTAIAIWDNDEPPAWVGICHACTDAYNA